MSTENKNEYILLFRGTNWQKGLSPEQMEKVMNQWMAWFNGLKEDGRAKGGQPLEPGGRVVSGKKAVVADGPYAESKEEIGGYFLLQVADIEEATAIAKQCPGLPYGIVVEVRTVADMCPAAKELEARAAHAVA
jgi:hypothetical protein